MALGSTPATPAIIEATARTIASLASSPPAERAAVKSLRPLLGAAWARLPGGGARDTMTALRTGVAREEMRLRTMGPIVERALAALAAAGQPFLLLRGLGVAATVYPEPVSRHCHDLDILVGPGHLEAALSALEEAGFLPAEPDPSRHHQGQRRVHASGLPVEVHETLFPERYYAAPVGEWFARSRPARVFGCEVAIPAPEHQLVQVLGLASCTPQRHALRWVTDAWFLASQTAGFDWDLFLRTALASRLPVPLDIQLHWLAEELALPVPTEVLARLRAEAERSPPVARDVALFGLRAGALPGEPRLGPATSLRDRLTLLRWMVLPSRAYLAHAHGVPARATLPLYVRRMLRALRGAVTPSPEPRRT